MFGAAQAAAITFQNHVGRKKSVSTQFAGFCRFTIFGHCRMNVQNPYASMPSDSIIHRVACHEPWSTHPATNTSTRSAAIAD
jgi:hypothetical protein